MHGGVAAAVVVAVAAAVVGGVDVAKARQSSPINKIFEQL